MANTTITAIPRPIAASIFLEMAKNVHIPRKTDNARFSMKIEDIKIDR